MARADGVAVSIIAHDDDDMPMALRVASELTDIGISVQTYPPGSLADPDEELPEIGARTGASAIIRIDGDDTLEVWTAGSQRSETLSSNAEENGERLLAIAAAEIIRARLLEGKPASPDGAQEPDAGSTDEKPEEPSAVVSLSTAATPESERAPAPSRRLTAELGPGIIAAGVSLGPTFNVFIGAALSIVRPLAVELFGFTPLVRTEVKNEISVVRVHTALVGGGLRLSWRSPTDRLRLYGAPGFTALFLRIEAEAAPGYDAATETAVGASPVLRLGASLALASRLRLDLALLAGAALSEVSVRTDDREIARLGRPLLAGALNLEVEIW